MDDKTDFVRPGHIYRLPLAYKACLRGCRKTKKLYVYAYKHTHTYIFLENDFSNQIHNNSQMKADCGHAPGFN